MGKLRQIFKEIKEIEPPKELGVLILKRLEFEKDRKIRREIFLSYAGISGSFVATFYTLIVFGNSFLKSEFWNMISLIFSDIMVIAGNLSVYVYSLLETFPFANLIVILVPLFAMILSINFFLSLKRKIKHLSFSGHYRTAHI